MSVQVTQRRQYTQHVNSRHDVASEWQMMVAAVVVVGGRGSGWALGVAAMEPRSPCVETTSTEA